MVRAECHTADDAFTVEFDVTPWLEEMDAETVALLRSRAGRDRTRPMRLRLAPGTRSCTSCSATLARGWRRSSREDPSWPTFTCRVDGAAALAWLEQNRPDVAGKVRGIAGGHAP